MKFDERKLYQKILKGDEVALKELMNYHKESFYAWASRRFDSLAQNEYEDAFAEAIIKFYEKATNGQFDYGNLSSVVDHNELNRKVEAQNSTIKTYLFLLAKNRLINVIAKKKVRINHRENVSLYLRNNHSSTKTEDLLASKERKVIVKRLLNKLPAKYKEILVVSQLWNDG